MTSAKRGFLVLLVFLAIAWVLIQGGFIERIMGRI